MQLSFSFIVPVYNRPQEIQELLASMTQLDFQGQFEVVIIEDGSTETAEEIASQFSSQLSISYYYKPNSGPGASRNYGMQRARGNYFIILDSDCLLPSHYLATVASFLQKSFYHCYGGADAAHDSFTPLQKAINYTMTSLFTTGGIRGRAKSINRFEPRSFNMGLSKEVFEVTGGFAKIHPGEDPDLSQRILKAGYETVFIPNAFVFHKRRISWKKFHKQVRKFGLVRPILNRWHPHSAAITFWFPTCFVAFVLLSVLLCFIVDFIFILPLGLYIFLVFLDSSARNRSLYIGWLSVIAMFVQFFGYGLAFLKSTFYLRILKKDPQKQFPSLFFN